MALTNAPHESDASASPDSPSIAPAPRLATAAPVRYRRHRTGRGAYVVAFAVALLLGGAAVTWLPTPGGGADAMTARVAVPAGDLPGTAPAGGADLLTPSGTSAPGPDDTVGLTPEAAPAVEPPTAREAASIDATRGPAAPAGSTSPAFDPRLPVYETVEIRPDAEGYSYLPPGVHDADGRGIAIPDDVLLSRLVAGRDDLDELTRAPGGGDPAVGDRLFARSLRLAGEGQVTAARRAAEEAWDEHGGDARLANHRADLAIREVDWVTAEAWSLRALLRDPEMPRAWTNLGIALAHRGRVEDAEAAHRRAVELAPSDWTALAALAATQARAARFDDAVGSYRNAILIAPQRPELRWNLALLLDRADRTEEARTAFRAYLRLAPRAEGARISRAQEWLADH